MGARLLLTLVAPGLLAGCMVGTNHHRPAVQTPTAFRDLQQNSQLQAQIASNGPPVVAGFPGSQAAGLDSQRAQAKLGFRTRHRANHCGARPACRYPLKPVSPGEEEQRFYQLEFDAGVNCRYASGA